MSLASWKKEFYPTTAERMRDASDIQLVKHSLRKWRGALPENCKKHRVSYASWYIHQGESDYRNTFLFGGDSCALCMAYPFPEIDFKGNGVFCPLYRFLGKPCYRPGLAVFGCSVNDPRPMISALEGTLRMLRGEPGEPVVSRVACPECSAVVFDGKLRICVECCQMFCRNCTDGGTLEDDWYCNDCYKELKDDDDDE